ncbi:hypothetical protein D3C78_1659860 [compost metagenome]
MLHIRSKLRGNLLSHFFFAQQLAGDGLTSRQSEIELIIRHVNPALGIFEQSMTVNPHLQRGAFHDFFRVDIANIGYPLVNLLFHFV